MIKDSGERREFATGALRDIQEGKGRCDLLPLDILVDYFKPAQKILLCISEYKKTGEILFLYLALDDFCSLCKWHYTTMLLEVSKHFEEGAKKYGEYNWQKGINTHSYIDSGLRHLLKWLRGDNDEPHDRAFEWNLLCCIWTCVNKPELNDYQRRKE